MVDVVQERVERLHALPQSAIEDLPFVGGNDPRHEVERNEPLGPGILAVHRERDPDPVKRALGLVPFLRDPVLRGAVQPPGKSAVRGPDVAIRGAHFVVG